MTDLLFDPDWIAGVSAKPGSAEGTRAVGPRSWSLATHPRLGDERAALESIFATVPAHARPDLASSFWSKKDWQHLGACFELYAWEFLRNQEGWNVAFKADLAGNTPDLFATRPNGAPLVVEVLRPHLMSQQVTQMMESEEFVKQDLDPLRNALAKKLRRYRDDLPSDAGLLLIVGFDNRYGWERDLMWALCGPPAKEFWREGRGPASALKSRDTRAWKDGLLRKSGRRNGCRELSGLLQLRRTYPAHEPSTITALMHNPWAEHPVWPPELPDIPHCIPPNYWGFVRGEFLDCTDRRLRDFGFEPR